MATDALRLQVAGKWQDCFKRLNREEPGISGLMSFSQVSFTLITGVHTSNLTHSRKSRHGASQRRMYVLKTSKTQVSWLSSPVSAFRGESSY